MLIILLIRDRKDIMLTKLAFYESEVETTAE